MAGWQVLPLPPAALPPKRFLHFEFLSSLIFITLEILLLKQG